MNTGLLNSIEVEELMDARGVIIDVRSENEFAEARIPTSENVPLLSNLERAEVGTLYKQQGAEPARKRGLEIVRPKLQTLLLATARAAHLPFEKIRKPTAGQWETVFGLVAQEILKIDFNFSEELKAPDESAPSRSVPMAGLKPVMEQESDVAEIPITFYCWRGGARSKSMALMAAALGFQSRFVTGGHKAYRNAALAFLEAEKYPFKVCTLYGLTGSGKTQIIRQWVNEGKPVVDLEALAHHRGSAFGQVGIDQFGQQKDFENNLFWEIKKLLARGEKTIVVEGESRRIGRCNLPESFMKAMLDGIHVKVNVSLEQRVLNIMSDYVAPLLAGASGEERLQSESRRALDAIKKKLGGEKHAELLKILESKDYALFTRELLVGYYDKMYQLSRAPENFYHAEITDARDWAAVHALL